MEKMSRDECYRRFPVLPEYRYDAVTDEETIRFPTTASSHVFILPAASFSRLAIRLGSSLAAVLRKIDVGSMIFLGDSDGPLRRKAHSHPPAMRGLRFLESQRIGVRFNGGLKVDTAELPVFIRHLLWLVRTNGILPQIWATDPDQRFVLSPCQYGGLHVSICTAGDVQPIIQAFMESGFSQIQSAQCSERFSTEGIPGRTLLV